MNLILEGNIRSSIDNVLIGALVISYTENMAPFNLCFHLSPPRLL